MFSFIKQRRIEIGVIIKYSYQSSYEYLYRRLSNFICGTLRLTWKIHFYTRNIRIIINLLLPILQAEDSVR